MISSIIPSKDKYDSSFIKEIDEQKFHDIVKYVNNLDINEYDIYEEITQSKYNMFPSALEREKLEIKLNEIRRKYPSFQFNDQGSSYTYIMNNNNEVGNLTYRYYFGVNPLNMYKLVEKLSEKIASYNIPVHFKFQKEVKRKMADRIVLYTDTNHRQEIEKVIKDVYNENKELFYGAENILPWIYESNINGVYFAPESIDHEKSYGELFSKALLDSKKIFHYFYQEEKVQNNEQLEFLKKVVMSCLLRNGVLLSKDNRRLATNEGPITSVYDKDKNVMKSTVQGRDGFYYEATFDSSFEGKKAYLNNFYSVKSVENTLGVTTRKLTKREKEIEIYNYLYRNNNTYNIPNK